MLFLASRIAIPFKDWFYILNVLNREVLSVAVEMNLNGKVRHQESSVTQRVPAVAVTSPLVAAFNADIFWPGETVMIVSQFAGKNGSAAVAVADAVES
jgi:hypothetical protein